ncbi:aromatic hydrocarbon degradation protein [Leptospira wolffii]|uniref:OmpP1/FadL family transporter n=1 Tax=Leptospira wolffii TaxID=409998 RepID=UPI0010837294|nr:outer membrane protein transport protein [Leptospira wolffii]TGK61742.1 aromatic hydrocarbon degradation protein [Leptospira wolffii]TGK70285.1 aromatic hydrocarbon degradation protein [Leptospira wolffii]TGK77208.1 aromatic hydrocarbon degradation protein [Leptospira wolffii]TGL30939.1 aromatic hydrocarbon degradation protein [Leptospira wolffii]
MRNILSGRKFIYGSRVVFAMVLGGFILRTSDLSAGSYGDIYGAHPAASGMAGAVTATVNNSSAVFYNVAGLGRMNEADLFSAYLDQRDKEKEAAAAANGGEVPKDDKGNPIPQDGPLLSTEPGKEDPGATGPWYKRAWYNLKDGMFTYRPLPRPNRPLHEVTFLGTYANPTLKNNAPKNENIKNPDDSFTGLGFTMNLNEIFDIGRTIRFGLNAIVPASGNLMVVNDQNPTVPRYLQSGKSDERPTIMAGVGVELWKDRLFAGVGITALAGGSGAILLKDVPISPDPVSANSQVVLTLKPMINPTYGLQFTYGKWNLGASYKRETYLTADPIPARAQTTLLGIQLDFDLALLDQYNPRVYSFGVGFRPYQKILLNIDANKEIWSLYELSRTKQKYSEPLNFHDTMNIRMGVEYHLLPSLKIRGGIGKRPSPVPNYPGENNWMDNDRMIYSAGISYLFSGRNFAFLKDRLKNPVIFDLAIMNQQLRSVEVTKYIPTERNPNYNYGGYIWSLSFSVSLFF